MSGEELGWLDLASHLHLPLQEVKQKTTSSEFMLWMDYLNQKKEDSFLVYEPIYYYLAQITAEIRRTIVKNPQSVKLDDFLLKFSFGKKENNQISLQQMKSIWMSAVGYRKNKKEKK